MKRIIFCSFALLSASLAFAQTMTVSNISNGNVTLGSGTICTGVQGVQVSGNTIILTGASATCSGAGSGSGSGSGNNPSLSVGPANPAVWTSTGVSAQWTINNPGTDTYSCSATISDTADFVVSQPVAGTTYTGTVSVSLATGVTIPALNGTATVTVACSDTTTPANTIAAQTASFTVGTVASSACTPTSGVLDTTQPSPTYPQLSRICSANFTVGSAPSVAYKSVATTDMGVFLQGGTYSNYKNGGLGTSLSIPTNGYMALAFTPTASSPYMYIGADTSFGVSTFWSVSSRPGDFSNTVGKNCSNNGSTMIWSVTTSSGACLLTAGQTYYLNLGPINKTSGAVTCNSGSSCTSTTLGFHIYN